jgi:hypothetical protein
LWDSLDSVESPAGSHDRILLWDWVERCVNMRHKLKLGSQPVKG